MTPLDVSDSLSPGTPLDVSDSLSPVTPLEVSDSLSPVTPLEVTGAVLPTFGEGKIRRSILFCKNYLLGGPGGIFPREHFEF